MPAYHISGPSGSGKSTVGKILQQRGFRVIETDFEDSLSGWYNNETGERAADIPVLPRPQKWVDTHDWCWDKVRMSELFDSVGDELVFFCGSAINERDFYDSFEKRFGLCVGEETLIRRLQLRDSVRWVDGSAELQRVLERNEKFKSFCIATGAFVIDASVSPDKVTDSILSHIENIAYKESR